MQRFIMRRLITRQFMFLFPVCLFLFCFSVSIAVAADNRPNIVFIFTDDHAYQAISAYHQALSPEQAGPLRNTTPHLDRLAAEGMLFTRCCVTNSICAPSRAAIKTGKYGHLNGVMANYNRFDSSQQTFPRLLQQAGYQTAMIGKWHLGEELNANSAGFDHTEVLFGQGPYYNPPMARNGERVQHTGYTTRIITDLSLEWIRNRDPSQPFLLMKHHKAPHREWDPYPYYFERYRDAVFEFPATFDSNHAGRGRAALEQDMTIAETMNLRDVKVNMPQQFLNSLTEEQLAGWNQMFGNRRAEFEAVRHDPVALTRWKYQMFMRDYMSCVASVDAAVGRVLQFLEDEGLAENTLVIYSSDQGFFLGEHGWFDKRFMYNESFKTPLIMRLPGRIKPGHINHDIVSNLDFGPTFLDVAGVPVPEDMQGYSLVPLFQGETPADWRQYFYYHYYEYPGVHMVKKHYGVYDGRFKLIHFYDDIDEWELYDLKYDPNELQNVYSDPKYAQEIARLHAALARLKVELKVPPVEINTQSYIFDRPLDERPGLRGTILRLRGDIERRRAAMER